jgi:hypothetical protein
MFPRSSSYTITTFSNFLFMALPLRLLIGLQMPLACKISIACLFCLGFVCIIASTIRVTQSTTTPAKLPYPGWSCGLPSRQPLPSSSPTRPTSTSPSSARSTATSIMAALVATRTRAAAAVPGPGLPPLRALVPPVQAFLAAIAVLSTTTTTWTTWSSRVLAAVPAATARRATAPQTVAQPIVPVATRNTRQTDVDNSSQEGLVDELRRANGGVINVTASGGRINTAGNDTGSNSQEGIVVTNTHVLKRTEGSNYSGYAL